jgi:Pyruvate/2-oxoglutarate dehydrogenase complex, dihydrolipoamide acyltransferase (E2) component, and related enzymes
MSEIEIKVPNIGDFKDVEVIEVLVSEGQTLKKNDPLITIESDKSSVEIPSNFDGKIKTLKTKVGDKVSEGDLILILENINEVQKKVEKKPESKKEIKKTQEIKLETQKIAANQNKVLNISSASPKVRKFARELGVDIDQVAGSERKGRVIESDIKLFVASKSNNLVNNENKSNEKTKQEYSHSEFGEVEIKDIPRVKKLSSKYLMNSWTNIPHVTNHDEADITELEEFRTSLTDIYTGEKKKITPLAFIVKALTVSLKKFPNFNSSIDDIDGGKMTVKKYYHIGIAVDTPHGFNGS